MDHLDKLIPLAILGAVGVFLVVLLRRAAHADRARSAESVAAPLSVPAAEPEIVMPLTPPAVLMEKPNKRARPPIEPEAARVRTQTTIQKVLGMLKDKDTLAAAFLLREILDRPVSRRH